jgi:tryptophan synthase alpha chain
MSQSPQKSQSRIETLFARNKQQNRTVLVAYLTVGDPSLEDSEACALAALEAGADVLELGVPFSDPTADGPTIAAASYRALQRGGSLRAALALAHRLRQSSEAPLVLFTYYNPVLAFGDSELPKAAASAGIDGLLVVDLPPEEGAELRAAAKAEHLAFIPLLAPTSDRERERVALAAASGFVYYVSMTGVTGSAALDADAAGQAARALRERAGMPLVVGFGIDSPDKARQVADFGVDGVVVGSQLVRTIADAVDTQSRVAAVTRFIGSLRAALDG